MRFKTSTIGNIALEIKTGKTPPTTNQEYFGSEIPWYTPGDLDRIKNLAESQRGITRLALDEKKAVLFKPNTVLIGCIGDIGKIGITKTISSSNQQITGIFPKEKEITSDFLYYWLKRNKKLLQNASTSSIVPILNNKQLASIKISFPENIADQIKIAHVLSKAEALIKQRKESIDLLDEFLKSTFSRMFGNPLRNEKGWQIKLLGDVCGVGSSKRVFVDELVDTGVPFFRGTEIGKMAVGEEISPSLFITNEHYSQLKKHTGIPKIGDLLMPSICSDGRIFRVDTNQPFYFKDGRVLWIKVDESIIIGYYLQAVLKEIFRTNYDNIASGTTFAELKIFALKQIKIPVAPISLQVQFAQIIEKTEILKTRFRESLNELEYLYQSLSEKAFKGELDLSLLDVFQEEEEYASYTNDRFEDYHFPEPVFKVEKKKKETLKATSTKPQKEAITKTKLEWESVSTQQLANWIIEKYEGFHFNSEMLIRFLMDEHITIPNYFSSEVLKKNPQTNEADDLKSFVFSAIEGENPFIKLEQVFYDANKENFTLKITPEDYELLKSKSNEERSGIYFNIIK